MLSRLVTWLSSLVARIVRLFRRPTGARGPQISSQGRVIDERAWLVPGGSLFLRVVEHVVPGPPARTQRTLWVTGDTPMLQFVSPGSAYVLDVSPTRVLFCGHE